MDEFQSGRSRIERKRQEEEQARRTSTHRRIEQQADERMRIDAPQQPNHRYVEDGPTLTSRPVQQNHRGSQKRTGTGTGGRLFTLVRKSAKQVGTIMAERTRSNRRKSRRSEEAVPDETRQGALKKQPVEKKKRRFKTKVFGLLLVLLIGFILFASQPFTFLLIGSDARPGESLRGSRSDSLSVMQFVPLSRTIQLTSIPRDTYTPISCEDGKKDKITHAFAFGGEECTQNAVSELLDVDIDSKIVISFDSFIGLIDQIGGIDLVSTGTFSEQDASGKANQYAFQNGKEYHMDGAMALAYSRHRKTDNDGARANRQSEVIQAVATHLLKPTEWTKISSAHAYMKEEMSLDISFRQMATAGLALALMSEREHLEIDVVSERLNGIFYDFPDEKALTQLREKLQTTFYGVLAND